MFEPWLAELNVMPLAGLDRHRLCDAATASGRLRSALDAFDARIAAAVDKLADNGPGASTVLRGASKCSQREADKRTRRAEALQAMPSAADALATGSITAEHVDALARAADATSAAAVEQSDLLAKAKCRPADLLANDTREWTRRHQSQADLEAKQRRQVEARRCVIFEGDDGMTVLHAEFDPVTGARVRSVLETACDRLYHADGGRDAAAGSRTPQQRRADALADLLTGAAAGDGTRSGPVRTQMLVIAHADGTAEIPGTGPIPATQLAELACNADLFGLVFDTDGQPLWHGTRIRLADDHQWRALIARDGGCVICNAHPSKCEAHHIEFYGPPTHGPTDIENLALVCRHEHHLIHDQGHQLRRRADGSWELRPPDQPRAGP
ncbi:MAG: DUF222 domain-containing protein [Acidimicrobiales bacterium]